jgi:hypothetical protein
MNYENYVFQFGKYEGQPLEDVLKFDTCYVHWCIENVDGFQRMFNKDMREAIEQDCREKEAERMGL